MKGDISSYKLRRTHAKSRGGCLRCKQQRKKCDELRPSCSRCANRMYNCEYRGPQSAVPSDHLSSSVSSPLDACSTSLSSSPSVNISYESLSLNSDLPGPLDATELDLLSHYLSHTSRTIPVDNLDHYALSVGMPNIAFRSRPVMSSLLALAAACKCHDLLNSVTALNESTLEKTWELLMLAERHHRSSLRHIQAAMSYSDCYDGILANAALMVLYASASHSIRVQLAITAKRSGQKLPAELLPMHSQWMSFIRAAHMASNAILNDIVDSVAPSQTDTTSPSPTTDTPNLHFSGSDVTVVLSPQDGPSESTKQLFLPLVASTYTQALKILRGEIEYTVASSEQQYPFTKGHQSLDVCFNSLLILETCASQAFSTKRTDRTDCDPKLDSLILKHIQKVSPWVGEYMISVTSMKSPRALRRTIMSFLNKVPGEFLTLIQSVLDSKFINTGTEDKMTPDSPDTDDLLSDSTCRLAMDIFAHWLVLVMLLDGVWWIGGIGEWELGQVIGLMKAQGSFHQSIDTGKGWWPESMYRVKLGPTSNL